MPNTIKLHRIFTAPPEKVFNAFTDPAALAKWLPPHGFTCTVHHLDVHVGGSHKMSFTNFTTGNSHSFGGKYLEPGVKWTSAMQEKRKAGTFDVILTNPPVGKKIVVKGEPILSQFDLGYKWKRDKETKTLAKTAALHDDQPPQILFLERCLQASALSRAKRHLNCSWPITRTGWRCRPGKQALKERAKSHCATSCARHCGCVLPGWSLAKSANKKRSICWWQ